MATRNYLARARAEAEHEVMYFWSQVDQLTADEWPLGVVPPPVPRGSGTAGFPDGTGLYWPKGYPFPRFPLGGVMLVGHYTDAADKHAARRENGHSPGDLDDPQMSTWRHLHKLCARAGLDLHEIFLTNVYVGLKEGNSHGKFPGAKDHSFREWCRAFLDDQIRVMQPRAVVTLGDYPRKEFQWAWGHVGRRTRAGCEFEGAALMHLPRPRSTSGCRTAGKGSTTSP